MYMVSRCMKFDGKLTHNCAEDKASSIGDKEDGSSREQEDVEIQDVDNGSEPDICMIDVQEVPVKQKPKVSRMVAEPPKEVVSGDTGKRAI